MTRKVSPTLIEEAEMLVCISALAPAGVVQTKGTLLTGQNWMAHVPNFTSYDKGLMMVTGNSKITPEEEAEIIKMLPSMSQGFLNR